MSPASIPKKHRERQRQRNRKRGRERVTEQTERERMINYMIPRPITLLRQSSRVLEIWRDTERGLNRVIERERV